MATTTRDDEIRLDQLFSPRNSRRFDVSAVQAYSGYISCSTQRNCYDILIPMASHQMPNRQQRLSIQLLRLALSRMSSIVAPSTPVLVPLVSCCASYLIQAKALPLANRSLPRNIQICPLHPFVYVLRRALANIG